MIKFLTGQVTITALCVSLLVTPSVSLANCIGASVSSNKRDSLTIECQATETSFTVDADMTTVKSEPLSNIIAGTTLAGDKADLEQEHNDCVRAEKRRKKELEKVKKDYERTRAEYQRCMIPSQPFASEQEAQNHFHNFCSSLYNDAVQLYNRYQALNQPLACVENNENKCEQLQNEINDHINDPARKAALCSSLLDDTVIFGGGLLQSSKKFRPHIGDKAWEKARILGYTILISSEYSSSAGPAMAARSYEIANRCEIPLMVATTCFLSYDGRFAKPQTIPSLPHSLGSGSIASVPAAVPNPGTSTPPGNMDVFSPVPGGIPTLPDLEGDVGFEGGLNNNP